jgi:hypothetical protein
MAQKVSLEELIQGFDLVEKSISRCVEEVRETYFDIAGYDCPVDKPEKYVPPAGLALFPMIRRRQAIQTSLLIYLKDCTAALTELTSPLPTGKAEKAMEGPVEKPAPEYDESARAMAKKLRPEAKSQVIPVTSPQTTPFKPAQERSPSGGTL